MLQREDRGVGDGTHLDLSQDRYKPRKRQWPEITQVVSAAARLKNQVYSDAGINRVGSRRRRRDPAAREPSRARALPRARKRPRHYTVRIHRHTSDMLARLPVAKIPIR